ncbi:LysE family translocator [Streptomyces sp. NPDC014685]|uniref:LysE family translocator n=1 Tax=Streptomyces sp. NPDC014685 TaxID=3364881 RepID=UPI0036FF2541
MEQFLAVAVAHFLALLIPGVDFFLIARTATAGGRRNAAAVCVGIAGANGIFITAAFSGLSLISAPMVLHAIQAAGGVFLVWIGIAFFRAVAGVELAEQPRAGRTTWAKNLGLGLASGLLNPKNALFYVSLAAALADAGPVSLVFYGVWMVTIVLVWDLFVAVALGSERALAKLSRVLPWLTKAAGGFLAVLGLGMILTLLTELMR